MRGVSVGRTRPNNDLANGPTSRWSKAFVVCGLAALVAWLAIAPEPPFFSEWESLSVYGTYGAQEGSSNGLIAPFGNIGGLGYSPVELSRSLLSGLGLPPTLWNIRLPSLLFGIGSIITLWILGRRIFTPRLGLFLAAVVCTAPMFVFYSSELIVVSASFFAFVLFLERLDFFAREASSVFGWLTLIMSLAFVLTLYGPVRIICTATLALCVCWKILRPSNRRLAKRLLSGFWVACVFPSALLLLLVLNPLNGLMLGPQLLFPRLAESALMNGSSISLWEVIHINGQIILEMLSALGSSYTSSFIQATQIQGRFPLSTPMVLLLAICGAGISLLAIGRTRSIHRIRNMAIMALLAITILPMMTSSVLVLSRDNREILLATLTDYRLIFCLVPLGLLCTVALEFILKYELPGLFAAILLVAFIVLHHVWIVIDQHRDFMGRVASSRVGLVAPDNYTQWLNGYALKDRTIGWASHFEQHADLRRWAATVAATPAQPGTIFYTPLSCFAEDPLTPRSLGEIPGRASSAVWASAYLADEAPELNPGFVFVPQEAEKRERLAGKEALWSASLERDADNRIHYVNEEAESARVVTLNGLPPDVILAFTELELALAREIFSEDGVVTVRHSESDCF